MKMLADADIPWVEHYFGTTFELILKPGRAITREDLLVADLLLVRAVTPVTQKLLQDTPIKFVGSVTAGADHMDTTWLDQVGIKWATASGCNAIAVADYIMAVIASLQKRGLVSQNTLRAGIIGVGNIGKRVVTGLNALGFATLLCDPLRAQTEPDFFGTSLDDFVDLDLVTLHTPLIKNGMYPTYHMIEKAFINRQKKQCILINTSRGAVIHFADLKLLGSEWLWCFDVWENEPWIDPELLARAQIATPHIAGYSLQSKMRGVEIIYQAMLEQGFIFEKKPPQIEFPRQKITFAQEKVTWQDVVLKIYDPMKTSAQMKAALLENNGQDFDSLRKNFQNRHEFGSIQLEGVILSAPDQAILKKIGIRLD